MLELNRPPLKYKVPTFTQVVLTGLEYLWAVVVILNGNSVYHASVSQLYPLLELSLFLTLLLLAAEMYVHRIRPVWDQLLVTVGLMIYAVVYLSVRQSQMTVIDFAILFVGGLPSLVLMFSVLHSRGELLGLMSKVFNVVVVLSLISLYYWTFGVMLRMIPANCVLTIKWGYLRQIAGYNGVHFVTQMDSTFFPGAELYRNSGIFTEAPMFNLWLDLALAGELFLRPRTSRWRVAVLVITIITTVSVTGILFVVLCAVIHICRNYHTLDRRQRAAILAAGSVLIPLAGIAAMYTLVLKSDTESYSMRLSDYVAGFRLWWDHPVFGGGYGNLFPLMEYTYSPNGVVGFSNSLTAVLGTGGLWMSLLFYIPQFLLILPKVTRDQKLSCFGICNLFLFCSTLYFARYVSVVLLAFAMVTTFGQIKKRG